MTCPDPEGKLTLPDGVDVPMGKGINSPIGQSSLLYNEHPLYSLNVVAVLWCLVNKTQFECNLCLVECNWQIALRSGCFGYR